MTFLNNMKIGLRLNLVLSLVMVVIISSLGIYTMLSQKQHIIAETDVRMFEQVEDLMNMVEIEIKQNQEKVFVGMQYAEQYFSSNGALLINQEQEISIRAVNQITKQKEKVEVNSWQLNNETIQESNSIVDAITNAIGGTATIFQKIPQGYLRVSTNVINKQGNRATGTYIPNSSPVAQAISNGETFYGRAFIVDDWYLTAYKPLVDENEVIGIIYYGVKEKNLANLKNIFESKKYFDTGYPYVVDIDGNIIIHPTIEGESIADQEFFEQMKNSTSIQGKTQYIWEGKTKYQYFQYIESIESYVSVSIYESELLIIIRKIRNALIAALGIGIALFVFVNTQITKTITSALNKGVKFAETIASGDLTKTLEINQNDEVGQLVSALNTMAIKLKEIVGGIISGSENIASASFQLSSTSEQLSQGASEQASSVEEVSSTMEEIAANIEQNTENSQQTRKISVLAQDGMNDAAERSQKVNVANTTIANKIKIINDIAFQTNILALNAAVEAARAGEHGRGFAVVAAEVRKLAERSKLAADEIVNLTDESLSLSEGAGKRMAETLPHVENTTKLVEEISAASIEQNNGATQINSAIQQLNAVTQQNAAASEEMATSSEELSSQAEQLKDAISYFSIDNKKSAVNNGYQKKPIQNKEVTYQNIIKPTPNRAVINLVDSQEDNDDFEKF